MNRLLIVCGIVVCSLVLTFVGGICYVAVKARPIIEKHRALRDEYVQTNAEYVFVAPDAPELSADRFSQYVRIRRTVVTAVHARIQQLRAQTKDGGPGSKKGKPRALSDREKILPVLDLFYDAGRVHIHELRKARMSSSEYCYLTRVLHGTISSGVRANDLHATDMLSALERENRDMEASYAIDAPHRKSVAEYHAEMGIEDIPFIPSNMRLVRENTRALLAVPEAVWVDHFLLEREKMHQSQGRATAPERAAEAPPAEQSKAAE